MAPPATGRAALHAAVKAQFGDPPAAMLDSDDDEEAAQQPAGSGPEVPPGMEQQPSTAAAEGGGGWALLDRPPLWVRGLQKLFKFSPGPGTGLSL